MMHLLNYGSLLDFRCSGGAEYRGNCRELSELLGAGGKVGCEPNARFRRRKGRAASPTLARDDKQRGLPVRDAG